MSTALSYDLATLEHKSLWYPRHIEIPDRLQRPVDKLKVCNKCANNKTHTLFSPSIFSRVVKPSPLDREQTTRFVFVTTKNT